MRDHDSWGRFVMDISIISRVLTFGIQSEVVKIQNPTSALIEKMSKNYEGK